MCGIIGFKQLENLPPVPEFLPFLEALMVESQIRGKHATGVSWVEDGLIQCVKAPIAAADFIAEGGEEGWLRFLAFNPSAAILHTRYSTSGDWTENANNQPIVSPLSSLALVHNGLVSQASKEEFEGAYQVKCATANDSEIILRKIIKARKDSSCMADAIMLAMESIHQVDPPIFACGFLNLNNEVFAVRDHIRPLWFFYIKP